MRLHGGYAGCSDDVFLSIPYARLLQEVRLTSEALQESQRQAWTQSAFIGWQVGSSMGAKMGSFDAYIRKMGLQAPKPKVSREQVALEKERAFKALALVEARFDGRQQA